ncbi:hypothetical protein BDV40DRAFT_314758 [Aspergillus tamarii]|uniref:NmrA-like domain-containing protein n=1 Tax=Aspergillus tamarii TaxID=41984 RepID=A0A5N6ULB4_ASPTM|nr:hypothetical protein BDV40DRAFT_314758 [Aspergillus tamarii]
MAPAVKQITIFGATGLQGSSVVHSLLRDQASNFKIRAITRDPLSDKSQALQSFGVVVVRADGWRAHEIQEACSGSWAAFVNTNSDDPVGRLLRSCSCLKARIEEYARGTGCFDAVCSIHAGWYYELFLSDMMAQVHQSFPYYPDAEGFLSLHLPRWGDNYAAPFIAIADDFGDLVHGILLDPHKWKDQNIQAVSEARSLEEFVEVFSKATGKKARYVPLPSWKSSGEGVAELEDARLLFAYGELTGGRYFGVERSSTATARKLKKLAATAQGKYGTSAELTSSIRNLVDQDTLAQVSRDVTPHFDKFWEGGIFTSKSRVVAGLAVKSTAFIEHIACNPLFLEVCDRLLASTYTCWYGDEQVTFTSAPQINAAIAISNSPGNEAQKLHRDDMGLHHTLPGIAPEAYTPGRDVGVGPFVAATQTTKENGATRFIPGSHLWDTSHRPDEGLTVPVEMQPGDAFIMLASCFHAGSANVSQEDRTIYSTFLSKGILRQVSGLCLHSLRVSNCI